MIAACGGDGGTLEPPAAPTPRAPSTPVLLANAYILPGAANLGPNAFGDEPLVIYKGERLRFVNTDTLPHDVVADSASLPEFTKTDLLAPGEERSFVMQTLGTTTFHCTIHPQMVGKLIVQEQ